VTVATIQQDITLSIGRTFTLSVVCAAEDPDTHEVELRDLTGWTGAMQIRASAEAEVVLAEADVTIDVATATVTATIPDEDTATMTWRSGVYDLIITNGIDVDPPLVEGAARLRRGVTR